MTAHQVIHILQDYVNEGYGDYDIVLEEEDEGTLWYPMIRSISLDFLTKKRGYYLKEPSVGTGVLIFH